MFAKGARNPWAGPARIYVVKKYKKIIELRNCSKQQTFLFTKEVLNIETRNIALREYIPPPAPLKIKINDISAILWS